MSIESLDYTTLMWQCCNSPEDSRDMIGVLQGHVRVVLETVPHPEHRVIAHNPRLATGGRRLQLGQRGQEVIPGEARLALQGLEVVAEAGGDIVQAPHP